MSKELTTKLATDWSKQLEDLIPQCWGEPGGIPEGDIPVSEVTLSAKYDPKGWLTGRDKIDLPKG